MEDNSTNMEQILNFLRTFPGFGGMHLSLDALGPLPGCGGIFPRGEETLKRTQDVLGGVRLRVRLTLEVLVTSCYDPGSDSDIQALLLSFMAWARDNCPALGEDTVLACKGPKLARTTPEGVATHTVTVTVDYTKSL